MKRLLNNLAHLARPQEEFVDRLWQRLEAEMPQTRFARHRQRFALASGALCLGFALSGTGAYAYTSSSVTPESLLYPVKTSMEWVEEQARRSPEGQAAFHVRMMERRERELEHGEHEAAIRELLEERQVMHLERVQVLQRQHNVTLPRPIPQNAQLLQRRRMAPQGQVLPMMPREVELVP